MLPLNQIVFTKSLTPDGRIKFRAEVSMNVVGFVPGDTAPEVLNELRLQCAVQFWTILYGDFMPDLHQVAKHIDRTTTKKDLVNSFMRNVWLHLNPDFKSIPLTEVIDLSKVNHKEPEKQ